MQTEWAGASMTVAPISPPYEATVGAMARVHDGNSTALGDPAKVAQVVLQIAEMENPPLRLILGSEAYAYAMAAAAVRSASDAKWRELSESTDRDDATDDDRDPLGTRGGGGP
jgi:hypothetical protein